MPMSQLRVLEAELLKMDACRDRLRNVALRARARYQYQEEKAAELETKSEVRYGTNEKKTRRVTNNFH